MIRAGVDVVRLNFSHGTAQDHIDRARAGARAPRSVRPRRWPSMADLQGPKIRVGKFAEGKVMLAAGQTFVLDAARTELGDVGMRLGWTTRSCRATSRPGDVLLLNDGLIVHHGRLRCTATQVHTHGQARRRAVQQQGHQQAGRRPDRAGADRQGHGGHHAPP